MVGEFLSFLAAQRIGILMLLLILVSFVALTKWILWMFGWGRYKSKTSNSAILFVFADFLVKIINDFRHLLALVIVILFAGALFTAMWPGIAKQDVNLIKEGLQAAAAALGGLLGSVIGYYFGESAANKRLASEQTAQPPAPAEQQAVGGEADIRTPPKPPSQ